MLTRLFGVIVFLVAAVAHAQSRYVSDRIVVELRRGPSTEYLILRSLEAGTAVEVLEQNSEAGYSRVRVVDQGTEGWILTRFLTAEPIARDRLAAAERALTAARERASTLETQVAGLNSRLAEVSADLEQTRVAHGTAAQELADIRTSAANVVEIRDQNLSLQQKLIERERALEDLVAENSALASRTRQNWFIVGAGVLLAGIVVGLVAPSLRRKRRSDW